MAKKEKAPKKVLERSYVVPLRREWIKVPRYKRAKKAATGLRAFLVKHMKPEAMDPKNVKILKHLNEELWKHGMKNPPHKVKITAVKDDKGIVKAELEGFPIEEEKKGKKKEEPKKKEKAVEKPKEEAKPEEKKPAKEAAPAASDKEAKVAGKEKSVKKAPEEKK